MDLASVGFVHLADWFAGAHECRDVADFVETKKHDGRDVVVQWKDCTSMFHVEEWTRTMVVVGRKEGNLQPARPRSVIERIFDSGINWLPSTVDTVASPSMLSKQFLASIANIFPC